MATSLFKMPFDVERLKVQRIMPAKSWIIIPLRQ